MPIQAMLDSIDVGRNLRNTVFLTYESGRAADEKNVRKRLHLAKERRQCTVTAGKSQTTLGLHFVAW